MSDLFDTAACMAQKKAVPKPDMKVTIHMAGGGGIPSIQKNININGQIITQTKSDGLSNLNVPKVDQYVQTPTVDLFKEYSYGTDDLSPFNQFRIKIVGTSTNAAVVPQLRNLRATALA